MGIFEALYDMYIDQHECVELGDFSQFIVISTIKCLDGFAVVITLICLFGSDNI